MTHQRSIFKYIFFALAAWFLVPSFYLYLVGFWASLGMPEFFELKIQAGDLSFVDVDNLYFKPVKVLMVLVGFALVGFVHGRFYHFALYPVLVAKTLYYSWSLTLISGLHVVSKPVKNGLEIENILIKPLNWLSLNAELISIGLVPLLISVWVNKKRITRPKTTAHCVRSDAA